MSRNALYISLFLMVIVIVGITVIEWVASGQSWTGFSSNPLIVTIVGGLIVGIILLIITLLANKADSQPITAAAFYVINVSAQFNLQGTLPPESQQARRNEIQHAWLSFREKLASRLPSELRSQLRDGGDVSVYLWTKTIFGNIESGTMLTGLTGDLIFSIRNPADRPQTSNPGIPASVDSVPPENSKGIAIYLPPGFNVPGAEAVSGTSRTPLVVRILKTSVYDRYAPGWTIVFLSDLGNDSLITLTIRGVTAPRIAGKYFFKIARVNDRVSQLIRAGETVDLSAIDEQSLFFIPIENWPVLLVKGEVDPATIAGTLRYGDYNVALHRQPIREAGRVWAHMTTRIDPYTGEERPDLPTVDAHAYVNVTAQGRFQLEGLAPGVYDIHASAAGYPQQRCTSGLTVLKGQSLRLDCYLQPGTVIHGRVLSKHYRNDKPWPDASFVKIELYNAPTLTLIPDPSTSVVSWSPADSEQKAIRETRGPQDVGPPQRWFVQGGTIRPFMFEFGVRGEYGAPRDLDGMVPQLYATWVNGLTQGRYYVRAWVFGYLQSAEDGATFLEYFFDVLPDEWAGERSLTLELRR